MHAKSTILWNEVKRIVTNRPYLKLIQQSVINDGIIFEEITPDFVYRARRGEQSFVMIDTQVGLNNSASTSVARSKSATYDVLHQADIPAVEHIFLLHPDARFSQSNPYDLALEYYDRFHHNVVIKQDDGSQGNHVYKVNSRPGVGSTLDLLFSLELDACIGPFYEAETEYRIVTLNHQGHIFLAKKRTTSWKHNLISGAISVNVDEHKKGMLAELASKASKAMGLAFCSVDILETNEGPIVIEINDKVMLDEYCKHDSNRAGSVSDLYRKALLQRFEQDRNLKTDI